MDFLKSLRMLPMEPLTKQTTSEVLCAVVVLGPGGAVFDVINY